MLYCVSILHIQIYAFCVIFLKTEQPCSCQQCWVTLPGSYNHIGVTFCWDENNFILINNHYKKLSQTHRVSVIITSLHVHDLYKVLQNKCPGEEHNATICRCICLVLQLVLMFHMLITGSRSRVHHRGLRTHFRAHNQLQWMGLDLKKLEHPEENVQSGNQTLNTRGTMEIHHQLWSFGLVSSHLSVFLYLEVGSLPKTKQPFPQASSSLLFKLRVKIKTFFYYYYFSSLMIPLRFECTYLVSKIFAPPCHDRMLW